MTNGNDRLDKVERILEETGARLDDVGVRLQAMTARQEEMIARQQYHDEALERHDAEMKSIRETIALINQAITADGENIRALARIAELHERRLDRIEGDEDA